MDNAERLRRIAGVMRYALEQMADEIANLTEDEAQGLPNPLTYAEESDLVTEMSAISKELGVEDPELKPLQEKLWTEMTARCGGHPGRMVRLIDEARSG